MTVVKPAGVQASQADLDAQDDIAAPDPPPARPHDEGDQPDARSAQAARRLGEARRRSATAGEGLAERAEELRDKVLEIEKTLLVPDLRDGWADRINPGSRLLDKLAGLPAVPALGDYRPTDVPPKSSPT